MRRSAAPFPFRAAVAIAALSFLVNSCGGDAVAGPDNSIARISLDPPSATMHLGETLQLTAKAFNSGNTPIAGAVAGITFASNDNAIVTVSANGLLHAVRIGSSVVTAKVGGFQQTALITVTAGFPGTLNKLAGDNASAETLGMVTVSPSVEVRDSVGNVVSGVAVTFAVGTGGGTITGATATTDGSGVATVGSWTLGSTAGQNTLTASVNGAASIIATTFVATAVPSSPTQLIITAASTSVPIGVPFPIPVSVEIQGRSGRVVPAATSAVTVTSGGRLVGKTTVTAVDGVARFADLALVDTGAYSLVFSSPGLTNAAMAVTIVPGPVLASPGATFAATRGLVDPPGQLAPLTNGGVGGPISGLTIASITYGDASTGWLRASLLGTTTPANVLLELQLGSLLPGTYTATVTVRGANTGALDLPVTFVVAGLPPTKLVVATEPVGGASSLATQPVIEFRDALGFIASQIQDSVTVGIRNGPAYLSGTTKIAAVNGIARFTDIGLNSAATFVLSFTALGLPIVTSRPLTITNYPGLFFSSYPLTTASGVRLSPQPVVVALFTTGEIDTFLQAFVTLSIKGVGGAKGQLFGTTEVLSVNGVATFTDIGINGTPGDYILTASEFGGAITNSISYIHIP